MVLRGLRPTIKAYVLQQHGVESLQDIAGMKELMDEVRANYI